MYVCVTDRPGSLTTQLQRTPSPDYWLHTPALHLHPHQDGFISTHLTPLSVWSCSYEVDSMLLQLYMCACLLPSCASFACLLRVLASFVCLPPSCACLSSMCILSSLHRVSLDYSINVCAVIHSSSVFATTSCKENTLITFLISTLKSLHWTSHLPAIDPFTSVAVNKFHLHSNRLCESFLTLSELLLWLNLKLLY